MKNLTRLAAAGLVLLAAGCAAVTKIDPGRVTIDNAYTVETAIEWARLKHGRTHLWTVDGPLLQELRFVTAIGEGDPIFDSDRARNMPRFTDSMTELEIVDFFRASIAALEVSDFRPAAFGDRPGFRFEFSYLSKQGLAIQGIAAGAIVDSRLYLIVYSGAREYYFPKHKGDVEQIVSSIRFI